jgi:hypothetical protein
VSCDPVVCDPATEDCDPTNPNPEDPDGPTGPNGPTSPNGGNNPGNGGNNGGNNGPSTPNTPNDDVAGDVTPGNPLPPAAGTGLFMEMANGGWPSTMAAGILVILVALALAVATKLSELREERHNQQRRLASIRMQVRDGQYVRSDREIAEALLKRVNR